jgi:hypothetical protein
MQKAVNVLIMQGNSDDEEEEIHQMLLQDTPVAVERLKPENAEATVQATAAAPAIAKPADALMHISATAYTGPTSESTISLLISLSGVPAVALADTGSTNTFLDRQFAMDHNIPISTAPARCVRVAGGGELVSQAIAYNHQFFIEGNIFSADFCILELNGSDAILGVNWFKLHNPVTFDFVDRSLTIGHEGTTYTFQDHVLPKNNFVITPMECSKLFVEQAQGYILYNI